MKRALSLIYFLSGYAIPKPSMIGALRWITYINVSHLFRIRMNIF